MLVRPTIVSPLIDFCTIASPESMPQFRTRETARALADTSPPKSPIFIIIIYSKNPDGESLLVSAARKSVGL
jgi:hypothetical protein